MGLVTAWDEEGMEKTDGNGEDAQRGEEERRGNPYKERKRVGGLCECMCACMPWVFINFPKIPHFSYAIKPRGKK